MELLIPLLIFGAGLIFSGIKSANESKKQAQREIDLSKLERPTGKAPLPKPQTQQVEKKSGKSIWQTLVDDFKEEYEKVEQEEKKKVDTSNQRPSASKRLEQEIRSKVQEQRKVVQETKRPERVERVKEKVQPIGAVESTVKKETLEVDSDHKQEQKVSFNVNDISFDEKAIINGMIMKEILGPPKSKQRRR